MTEQNKIEFKLDDIRGKKLFVAAPMYGGQCAGMFCKSMNDLSLLCGKYGIDLKVYYLMNESLISRARAYCAAEFLRSDADLMLFIDSDIGFNPKDVFTLMYLCDENERPVIGGPYPKKTISWEKVKKAVDLGYADENPFNLAHFAGDFVFNPAKGIKSFSIGQPVEVLELGTGFMMIHRIVFEKFDEVFPHKRYKPDHIRTEHFDGSSEITMYFDCEIDPETRRYLSEDYLFCYNVQKMGMKVWMCPWMQLNHVGSYTYSGSMGALAAIQASPTASKESNQKFYKDGKNRAERRKENSKRKK